jgi:hypothetical protein
MVSDRGGVLMLDLLAQTDPLAVGGWLIMLVALGMYPVGILLPGCSPCCGSTPCSECPDNESLPDTVTVTFGSIPDEMAGPYEYELTVQSLLGRGALAVVSKTGNGGLGEAGAITGITILDPGSNFATLQRKAPTLTISGSGSGATFTPTFSSSGSPPVWSIESVAASGGSGYTDGEPLTITAAASDTVVTKAVATLEARQPPTITATAGGLTGSGAALAVTLAASGASPQTWVIQSIAVTSGGTGYQAGDPVTLAYEGDVVVSGSTAASVTISAARTMPGFSVDATDAGGSGATFSFTYVYDPAFNDWELTAIAVTNGGSGYTAGGAVVLTKTADTEATGNDAEWSGTIALDYTVSGGAITSVSGWGIPLGGLYGWRPAGIVDGVTFDKTTTYYRPTSSASGVTVTNGGSYYNDKTLPPNVQTTTVVLSPLSNDKTDGDPLKWNALPSSHKPEFAAVVDSDAYSTTFGQISRIDIVHGGQDFTSRAALLGKQCCSPMYAGKSFTLQRKVTNPVSDCGCVWEGEFCNGEFVGTGSLRFVIPAFDKGGPCSSASARTPYLEVNMNIRAPGAAGAPGFPCRMLFTAPAKLTSCAALNLTLNAGPSATVTVVGGGSYSPYIGLPANGAADKVCSPCCASGMPRELTATLAYEQPPGGNPAFGTPEYSHKLWYESYQEYGFPVPAGAYVLNGQEAGWRYEDTDNAGNVEVGVYLYLRKCGRWFNNHNPHKSPAYKGGATTFDRYIWDEHVGLCGQGCSSTCAPLVVTSGKRPVDAQNSAWFRFPNVFPNDTPAGQIQSAYHVINQTTNEQVTAAQLIQPFDPGFDYDLEALDFGTAQQCAQCKSCDASGSFAAYMQFLGPTGPYTKVATLSIS